MQHDDALLSFLTTISHTPALLASMITPEQRSFPNSSAVVGSAQDEANRTVGTFLAALGSGGTVFAVEFLLFYLLKDKFTRI